MQMIQIPKIIHYCWFGSEEPDFVRKNVANWRLMCPEFEIKKWDNSNFDVNCDPYVADAASLGQWAFVSDVARLMAISQKGGIYLDTDVILKKNLSELIEDVESTNSSAFFALEFPGRANTGLGFGGTKGNKVIDDILSTYTNRRFRDNDGKHIKITTVDIVSDYLHRLGLNLSGKKQILSASEDESVLILPTTCFPNSFGAKKKDLQSVHVIGIHENHGSWKNNQSGLHHFISLHVIKLKMVTRLFLDKLFGYGTYDRLKQILNF